MKLKLCNINTVVDQIANIPVGSNDCYGRHLQNLFVDSSEIALLFIQDKLYILANPQFITDDIQQITLLWLTKFLAEINVLLKDRCCLQIPSVGKNDFLCCANANEFIQNGINRYSVGDDMILSKEEEWKIKKGEDVILQEIACNETLYDELYNLLSSRIYPTAGLLQYIEHKYKTIEEYSAYRTLRLSNVNIWVAIFVCCLSPILNVVFGNKYGKTEIKGYQYETIINEERAIESNLKAIDKRISQDTISVKVINKKQKQ